VGGTRFYDRQPGGGLEGVAVMVQSLATSTRNGGGWRAKLAAVGWIMLPVFFALTVASALQEGSAAEAEALSGAAMVNATQVPAHVFVNAFEEHCGVVVAELDGTTPDAGRRLKGAWLHLSPSERSALLTNLALAAGIISCIALVVAHMNNDWIQPLKRDGITFTVEEVQAGFATVPIIVVVNITYNLSYNAMNNAMPSQACQMNTIVGGRQLNGAFFTLGDAIAIIALTPLFESVVYPIVSRVQNKPVGINFKLITGLFVVGLANVVAAVLELQRRHAPLMCWEETSECAPNGIHMRDISALWIFLPNALIGASEIMVNPCLYYFAYTMAPPRVRSLVQAFNLFCSGAVSNAFTAVVTKVAFPDDLDTGNLEYYYYINAVAALLGIVIFFFMRGQGQDKSNYVQDSQESVASESSSHPPEASLP